MDQPIGWEDIATLIGVVVSLALGIGNIFYSLHIGRRTLYVNSVTAERVKWINALRENLAELAGLTYNWSLSDLAEDIADDNADSEQKKTRDEMVLKIDKLRMMIKLQLNPEDDKAIIGKIDEITEYTHRWHFEELKGALNELIKLSQSLLKKEWEVVKDEATAGLKSSRRKRSTQ